MCRMFRHLLVVLSVAAGLSTATIALQAAGEKQVKMQRAPDVPLTDGAGMFKTYCAVCHGLDGSGNGPAAKSLKKAPRDLTQLAKTNGGRFPDQRFREVVGLNALVTEHGAAEMPMWGNVFRHLSGGDDSLLVGLRVKNLMDYVRTIQR